MKSLRAHVYVAKNLISGKQVVINSMRELVERFAELDMPSDFMQCFKPSIGLFHHMYAYEYRPKMKVDPNRYLSIDQYEFDPETFTNPLIHYKPVIRDKPLWKPVTSVNVGKNIDGNQSSEESSEGSSEDDSEDV